MNIKDIPIDFNVKLKDVILTDINMDNPFMKKLLELEFLAPFDKKKSICLITQKAKTIGYKSILEEVLKKKYTDIQKEIILFEENEEIELLFTLAKKHGFSLTKESIT